ncbi:MAG: DJ-1/PfpI family protein [Lachnospiraceae bacterium]|nr:DJ-1/PfpI family protein [Lachnospiraceae bacterium]
MTKICAFLAAGLEEVECLAVVDVLRRAGMDVTLVSAGESEKITGSHGITVLADRMFDTEFCRQADLLFLPGGMPGTTNLGAHKELCALLEEFDRTEGKRLAAICAAPTVLGRTGCLKGKKAACYPDCESELGGGEYVRAAVVTDGNVTTARGLGAALDLGLELVRIYQGEEAAKAMKEKIQYY